MNRNQLHRRLSLAAVIASSVLACPTLGLAQEKSWSVASIGRTTEAPDTDVESEQMDEESESIEDVRTSAKPMKSSFAQTRNEAMRTRSAANKPPVAQMPRRGQPARVAEEVVAYDYERSAPVKTAAATNRNSKSSVRKAAAQQEGVVQAQAPMDAIYEESNPVIIGSDIEDPVAYQFQPSEYSPRRSSGLQIQFHELSPLGILLTRTQLRVEGATYWGNGYGLPRLITTDGAAVTAGSTALFGGSDVLNTSVQGVRGEFGFYLDRYRTRGLAFRFFQTSDESVGFQSTPTSHPTVSRVFDRTPLGGGLNTSVVNLAGANSGSADASLSREVYGGDIFFRTAIGMDRGSKLELITGYQQARYGEFLSIATTSSQLPIVPGSATIQITDTFRTTNLFNAATIGLSSQLRGPVWSLNGMFKLGVGEMQRHVAIAGQTTTTTTPPLPTTNTTTDGLLARRTNNGDYVSKVGVISPETAVTLGYRVNRNLEASLTYTYLGLPKVARAGEQLDPNLAANLDGDPFVAPRFALQESNFHLHSLSYGLQWRY